MCAVHNTDKEFQDHLNKLEAEYNLLSDSEISKKAASKLAREERDAARKMNDVNDKLTLEERILGNWWSRIPLYSWDNFKGISAEKFARENEHQLAFDCVVSSLRARCFAKRSQMLTIDEYATFVRAAHLVILYDVNKNLALKELERMAIIDSQVIMEDSTKLEHNLIKMIDYLEEGWLYARSDKSDAKKYQNTHCYVTMKKRALIPDIKQKVILEMKKLLLECQVNKVIKKKDDKNRGVALF